MREVLFIKLKLTCSDAILTMTTNIYILKCEEAKYYVGKSEDPQKRFQEHLTGNGSSWTRKYKPINIEKIIENASPFDEDKYTKEYMAKYGFNNVRGGTYVSLELDEFQVESLKREIWMANDCCANCGRKGHFVKACYAKTDVFGDEIEYESTSEESSSEEEIIVCADCNKEFTSDCTFNKHICKPRQSVRVTCFKCGREGHWANTCYAKRHINGKYLEN